MNPRSTHALEISRPIVDEILKSFLKEDVGYGDLTTDALVNPSAKAIGTVICNEPAVIAGLFEAQALLEIVGCKSTLTIKDGDKVQAKTQILKASGPAISLLKVERTLLNIVSHMSGVATATSELIDITRKAGGGEVRIACTRKTLPGLRYFEKQAVRVAGGDTHRLRLDDAVLIKDNHLALAGTVAHCVRKARDRVSFTKKIEVEATDPSQALEAATAGADIVLLDNMKPERIGETIALLQKAKLRDKVIVEASGGIRRDNLAAYARMGVDVISVGMITHSAKSIDLSMDIRAVGRRK